MTTANASVHWLTDAASLDRSLRSGRRSDVLVMKDPIALQGAFQSTIRARQGRLPRMLIMAKLGAQERAAYEAISDGVVDRGVARLLPLAELQEALEAPHRDELFIGAAYAPKAGVVTLYRGTLEPLLVPVSWFEHGPSGQAPDFEALGVTDYGQTIRLGAYEVAADAVLYEFDADYRRRAKARARQDDGLGGSIRRLRRQRGLSQDAVEGLSRRELGRIERGEVGSPRPETLGLIARALRVEVDALASF